MHSIMIRYLVFYIIYCIFQIFCTNCCLGWNNTSVHSTFRRLVNLVCADCRTMWTNSLYSLLVMIVAWYQYSLFSDPDSANDSDLSDDGDFIDDLNSELDWWEYQEETWLAIGTHHHCWLVVYRHFGSNGWSHYIIYYLLPQFNTIPVKNITIRGEKFEV